MSEFEGEISVDGRKFKVKGEFNSMNDVEQSLDSEKLKAFRIAIAKRMFGEGEQLKRRFEEMDRPIVELERKLKKDQVEEPAL